MIPSTQLQKNVLAELDWDPSIDAAQIGVIVDDGVVTLTGTVSSFAEKLTAERLTRRVAAVKAIANNLTVKLPSTLRRTDTDIAKAALNALQWDIRVPHDRIKLTVNNAWITLEGEVDWNFEREAAVTVVRHLTGVVGVTNLVTIRPKVEVADVKDRIEDALKRSAEIDAQHVKVTVEGGKVILSGTVRSWAEHEDAENAAWAARGVAKVENRIVVEPGTLAFA